jgi:hypothetical protein
VLREAVQALQRGSGEPGVPNMPSPNVTIEPSMPNMPAAPLAGSGALGTPLAAGGALATPLYPPASAPLAPVRGRIDVNVNHNNPPTGTTLDVVTDGGRDLDMNLGQAFAY